jgi:hypothetical protein
VNVVAVTAVAGGCPGVLLANVVSIPWFQAARLGRSEEHPVTHGYTVRDM